MAISRYANVPAINFGKQVGTSRNISAIRNAIQNGTLAFETQILKGSDRLDTIAGSIYGEGQYWWVIAAASNIGWGLQVPAGTILRIPKLNDVLSFVV